MVDEVQRRYHFGFAVAGLETLSDDIAEALNQSWNPGASVTRYGRRWHLTRVLDETPSLFFGKIGFVNEGEVSTLVFDRNSKDFVLGEAPSGVVVPFAVRKEDGLIVFQLYPGVVRETTFTGALEDLLNSNSDFHVWNIYPLAEEQSFESWARENQGIARFDFTLERPNPNYRDRPLVEELVEETRLEVLRLTGRAVNGENIDPESDLFRQALDHVLRNYGKAKLVATDSDGNESTWVKIKNASSRVLSRRTRTDYGPDQASEGMLVQALSESPGSEAVPLHEFEE